MTLEPPADPGIAAPQPAAPSSPAFTVYVQPAPVLLQDPAPYHRLTRTLPGYAWWRALVALVLTFVFFLVGSLVVGGMVFGLGVATGDIRLDTLQHLQDDLNALAVLDAAVPIRLLFALMSLAVLLPAVQLALLCAGIRPISVRHSVTFRVRWGWMLRTLAPALAIFVLGIALSSAYALVTTGSLPFVAPTTELPLFLLCAAIIVVLTPLQAAAEEYIFRGLLAQMLGGWIRYLPVSIVLSTLAFASLHAYDFWGLVDVFLFGLAASLVVWRTGGLEAGIAMHSVNNVGAFLLLASGITGTTINETETVGVSGPILSLIYLSVWVFWMERLARRKGIARLGAWRPKGTPPTVVAAGAQASPAAAASADPQARE
ncbi:MAG TPA: type II CAAX endopeptidase family protein [Pseudolysinimonas sp.]|nr:type II CAAX endopeptidase family protein [Pseudolysinimonas sp.]